MIFHTEGTPKIEKKGGTRIATEALKEGWCQCSGVFWEWTEVGTVLGKAQEIESIEDSLSILSVVGSF